MLVAAPDRTQHKEPTAVAEAFLHAMTNESPKRRYLVVPNQDEASYPIEACIARIVQLNEDQPFSYTREQLIEMLDDALKAETK